VQSGKEEYMICRNLLAAALFILPIFGCSQPTKEVTQLYHFSVDDMEGVIGRDAVEFDGEISRDGHGSLKVTAAEATVVRLFQIRDPDVENACLIYRAWIRTEDVDGRVFLEMWCRFPGRGEFFSRGLHDPLSGTTDWSTRETPFFLKKGENPDLVELNLVLDGKGTVWIDDIGLLKGPLK
jgi:hypothetical protein